MSAVNTLPSPAPEPPLAPLSKQDLLAALDAQIRFVSDAERNEGWTRWAIWGALAAILWHGTELVTHSEFTISRSVLAALAVFIIWAVLESIIILIAPSSRVIAAAPLRFHMWTDLVSVVRPGVMASALRQALVIFALAAFHYPDQWPLWTYAIVSLLGDLAVFTPGMSNLTFPSKFGMRTAFTLATLIPMAWLVFAGMHVARLIQNDWSGFALADVRFALLMNAGAYLLIRLTTRTTSSHFLNELTEVRQHLAFDRINIAVAMQQSEKLLSGMKLSEVLNPSVDRVFKEAKELGQTLQHSTELLNQLRTGAIDNPEAPHDAHATVADTLLKLDELDKEASRLDEKLKAVSRARGRFQMRLLGIILYSRESVPELKEPLEKVQTAFTEARKLIADFHAQLDAVKTELRQVVRNHSGTPH